MNLEALFRDMPVKRKLMYIVGLSVVTATLLVLAAMVAQQWLSAREDMKADLLSHARLLGANARSALMFGDRKEAEQTLRALENIANIEYAEVDDGSGKPFASYTRHGFAPPPSHHRIERGQFAFDPIHVEVGEPIIVEGELVGTIHLVSNLSPMYDEMARSVAVLLAVMLGGLLIALALIARLHTVITRPIAELVRLMDRVSSEKDYTLRSELTSRDELGVLGREFNGMLAQIQQRDEALEQARAHLEQEVAQRTANLTEAQRIAHLGNWEWDIVNNILTWSDEIYRIFGLMPQQFGATYEAFLQAVHPDDRPLVDVSVRAALEEQRPYGMDHRILMPDGTVRYVHEQAEVIRGEDGRPIKMVGTVQDITERKEAARSIEESERKFRAILEAAVDGILVADGETGKFMLGNRAICDMLGYREDEISQLSVADIHPPEALAEVQRQFARQLSKEVLVAADLPVKRKNGSVFFADVSSSPMELAGHPYLVGIFHDVTERLQAEVRIRESEARYRGIFEYADDIIYLLEPDGTFRSLSPSFEKITGWSTEEWIGRPFAPIVHPEDLSYAAEIFGKTLTGIATPTFRLRLARKSGEYFDADLSITPIGRETVTGVLGIARDITERRQMEERIRKLNEELEIKVQERTRQLLEAQEALVRKEKLAVLGQVAGSVGHELRNPLGVMSNAVYFLQTVLADADESVKEYLGIIKNEIAGSERIVSDLLDSVRTKTPYPQSVAVPELVEQTLSKIAIPPSVGVKLDIPLELPPLRVDAMQIRQVLRNLVSNSVEAMPGGGVLEIRAAPDFAGKTVTLVVKDSGTGMTQEQMDKMFQPLYTTKARGIGLGLVVVKNLTEANGGKVEVRSEPGRGTEFFIVLPADLPDGGAS